MGLICSRDVFAYCHDASRIVQVSRNRAGLSFPTVEGCRRSTIDQEGVCEFLRPAADELIPLGDTLTHYRRTKQLEAHVALQSIRDGS